MKTRLILLLAATTLLGACGGPPADDPFALPAPDDTAGWADRFRADRWVTAWGLSTASFREAEQDARAQVAAQVQSSITAETTSLARAVMRDDEVSDFQELVSEVRTTTTFTRAQLIRRVDQTVHVEDGVHKVLAVLDRHELATHLQDDYDAVASAWRRAADGLAPVRGDLPAWTVAWHRFRGGFAEVLATAAETRAATGLNPQGYTADQARWSAGHAARDSVLRSTVVVLSVAPEAGLDPVELAERLAAGFAELGVTTRVGACARGDRVLRLQPTLTSRTVIGRVVSLELRGTFGPCTGGLVWSEVAIDGAALRGDGRDPEADLLASMTPEALAPLLRASLGHVIPF
jgi:hypothetical protein